MKIVNPLDPIKLAKDVGYSTVDLDTAFQRQAALYVEYGRIEAQAARQVNDLELIIEIKQSELYRKLRDDVVAHGKKVVVSDIKEDVAVNPIITRLRRALNEAKQIQANAKHALKAFEQRRDMLVQSGAKDRKERDGEMRMRGHTDNIDEQLARVQKRLEEQQG
jgi:hypothetical protein